VTILVPYLLTAWSRVLEKLTGLQQVKKFPTFNGNQRLVTALKVPATCPYPDPARSSPYLHIQLPEDPFNIILLSISGSPKWSLSFRFPHQNSVYTSPLPHMHCMSHLSHSSRFYHPNNIGRGVQMIKLLIM